MNFALKNKEKIIEMYKSGESTHSIAKHFNTYPNKIKRALDYLGVKTRTKSEAQNLALKSGRSKHPTEGKSLSKETRLKIGEGSKKAWEGSEERKKKASNQLRSLSDEQKENRNKKAIEAIRLASKEGSKLEKYIGQILVDNNYRIERHVKNLRNTDLEVDIYIPDFAIAIEIDGISHVEPIWGEEKFKKQKRADREKESLLTKNGVSLIRVIHSKKSLTLSDKEKLGKALLRCLNNIDISKPTIKRIK